MDSFDEANPGIILGLYESQDHDTIVRNCHHWFRQRERAKAKRVPLPELGLLVRWIQTDQQAIDARGRQVVRERKAKAAEARRAGSVELVRQDFDAAVSAQLARAQQVQREAEDLAAADAAWASIAVEVLDTATRRAEADPELGEMARVVLRKLVEHGRLRDSATGRQIIAKYLPREVLAQLPVAVTNVAASTAQAASA